MSKTEQPGITRQRPRASNWSMPPEAIKEYEELKAKSSGNIIFVYKPKVEDKPDSV